MSEVKLKLEITRDGSDSNRIIFVGASSCVLLGFGLASDTGCRISLSAMFSANSRLIGRVFSIDSRWDNVGRGIICRGWDL